MGVGDRGRQTHSEKLGGRLPLRGGLLDSTSTISEVQPLRASLKPIARPKRSRVSPATACAMWPPFSTVISRGLTSLLLLHLQNWKGPESEHRLQTGCKPEPTIRAKYWRPRPESNRGARICSPLRHHSATWPV